MNPANPENLENDLRQALSVEPSPEFVARVRMRIAAEPTPSVWWRPRGLVTVGALAAVLVATVYVLRPHEQPSRSADLSLPADRPTVVPERNPEPVVVQGFSPAVSRPAIVRPAVSRSKRGDPEVLVSQAEMKGLRRLIALASQGDPDLQLLLAAPVPSTPVSDIQHDAIVIAPISIDPLEPDTY
jgi:negative regulator of sigma E activity